MSRQVHVRKGWVLEEEGQSRIPRRIPSLVIGLTALVLVALAVLAVMRTDKPSTLSNEGESRFVANPELMVARQYTSATKAESGLLAANPELMAARRYRAPAGEESSLLAANPELVAARRFTAPADAESSFLAANPELMATRRYTSAAKPESSLLATNPELMTARRYRSP